MVFKDWEINVVYSGKHEVVTNETSLFVIDEDYDVAIAIKYLDGKLKVSHVNYGSEFTIDPSRKVLELIIINPNVDEN
ncbi:hypothetical protein [Staphylococcus argenteus]|uniref:hypothetical protein n=1 Tax=Staphylococcus argenteus TaxID=985002 RepID=UPI0002340102|nr:hypothetical protein [Staphylococcus argenteus]API79162.1 hypothetical protein A7971_05530 [Staphylococcus argenteus]MBE2122466.1 hypothetical protein [Staphylococcus argenteus]MBE2130122.1 hypothetical protein [Staphylococcus argenteus]MBE2141147.1 hypothetical protein [Staphylococcus argenteus]MCG6475587.1 hypothetical protein [Staphylococcus argenteus]